MIVALSVDEIFSAETVFRDVPVTMSVLVKVAVPRVIVSLKLSVIVVLA